MSKLPAIAWREFKHTALTKAFIIGTIVFPLLIWGGLLLVPLFTGPAAPTDVSGTLAIIDPSGRIAPAVRAEIQPREAVHGPRAAMDAAEEMLEAGPFGAPVRLLIDIEAHDDPALADSLRDKARRGDLVGMAVIDPAVLEVNGPTPVEGVVLTMAPQANPDHAAAIRRALGRGIVRARADAAGLDLERVRAILRQPPVHARRLTADGEVAAGLELQQFLPIAFMILLWVAAFASGNYLLTTTIEEKSNKVMEVLLSAVSPLQLMTGKIVGQAIVGLFTIAVYGALGIAALSVFAMADLIQISQIIYLLIFFLMAYFMVAAIMAAVGSAVSDLQEAHALITPAMLVLFIPMILFIPVSQNPNGTLAVVTSFLPPLTPFVMIVRVTAPDPAPLWQTVLAIIAGWAGVAAMVWMAARIFRVGVLMYGKPPSPLELLKWVRYS